MSARSLCSDTYKESFLVQSFGNKTVFEAKRMYDEQKVLVEAISLAQIPPAERKAIVADYRTFVPLRHINILAVSNVHSDSSNSLIHVEFEYLHGTLDALICDAAGASTPIPFSEDYIWEIATCVAQGLRGLYLADGLLFTVHGQLWPQNIFRTAANAFVIGLPLLRYQIAHEGVLPGYARARASYLAPEVVHSHTLSDKSDIWIFGCLLYELCVLKPLPPLPVSCTDTCTTQGPDLSALQQQHNYGLLSQDLLQLINLCLQTSPGMRPSIDTVVSMCKKQLHDHAMQATRNATSDNLSVSDLSSSMHPATAGLLDQECEQIALIRRSQHRIAAARDTLLFMAIANNDLEGVIGQKSTFLRNPANYLQYAVNRYRSEVVHQFCLWNNEHRLGISVSARPGISSNAKTPLMVAAHEGNPSKVLETLHLVGYYHYNYLTGGETALYYAMLGRNPECVKLLLCELGVYNAKGYTASALMRLRGPIPPDYANLLLPEGWIQPRDRADVPEPAVDVKEGMSHDYGNFDDLQKDAEQCLEQLSTYLSENFQTQRK